MLFDSDDDLALNEAEGLVLVSERSAAETSALLLKLITNISTGCGLEYEYFKYTETTGLRNFQESPVLLDPHMPELTSAIFKGLYAINLKDITDEEKKKMHQLSNYLNKLIHIRGRKKMEKYFPHEVKDIRVVLGFIDFLKSEHEKMDDDKGLYNTKSYTNSMTPGYFSSALRNAEMVFLGWLGAVMRVPFAFEKIDAAFQKKVIDYCTENLFQAHPARTTASWCLARYFSRNDSDFTDFVNNLCDKVTNESNKYKASDPTTDSFTISGALDFLCNLYKISDRKKLIMVSQRCFDLAVHVVDVFENLENEFAKNSSIEKMCIKLVGRVALAVMKPCTAKWKYNRGNRVTLNQKVAPKIVEEEEEVDVEVPEIIEDIIGILINSLNHNITVVRWNGAKQLGRVVERLDKENGTHICETVLDMMDHANSEDTWHGAASAVAEFSRRNLIVKDLLEVAIDKVLEGLKFDKRRGDGSIGSNVRDACCYVAWTLARGFNPEHLKPYVTKIMTTLLLVSCFDREISCRRAAQAALQENIGRLPLGYISNGLDINQAVNFMTISTLERSTRIGAKLANVFPEYRPGIIEYLVNKRLVHWELDVRHNAAEALRIISAEHPNELAMDSDYIQNMMIFDVNHDDVYRLHGYIHGLAAIFENIVKQQNHETVIAFLTTIETLLDTYIFHSIHFKQPDKSSHLLRPSILSLLHEYAKLVNKMDLQKSEKFGEWSITIQKSILKLGALSTNKNHEQLFDLCDQITPSMKELRIGIKDMSILDREYRNLITTILSDDIKIQENARICACYILKSYDTHDYQTLKCLDKIVTEGAVNNYSLTSIARSNVRAYYVDMRAHVLSLLIDNLDKTSAAEATRMAKMIECCFDDYTRNNNGDIGSRLRIAALKSIQALGECLTQIPDEHFLGLLRCCVQQGAEKILNIRTEAAYALITLFTYGRDSIPEIKELENCVLPKKHREQFYNVSNGPISVIGRATLENEHYRIKDAKEIYTGRHRCYLWSSDWGLMQSFKRYTNILAIEKLQKSALRGLIVSSGDLTESLSTTAASCLFKFVENVEDDAVLESLVCHMLEMWKSDGRNLIGKPVLKVLDELLSRDYLDTIEDAPCMDELFEMCLKHTKSKDAQNAINAIACLAGLMRMGKLYHRCLKRFKTLLAHSSKPFIRYQSAEKLIQTLEVISICTDVPTEAVDILKQTDWIEMIDISIFKEKANAVYTALSTLF